MYFSRFIIMITLAVCISSCAKIDPPAIKQLDNITAPKYSGHITPISIPIQPMYKPVEAKTELTQISYAIVKEDDSSAQKDSSSINIWADIKIKNMGNLLVWDVNINKMKVNGELIDPSVNVAEFRFLSDRYGEIKESETTAPELERLNKNHQAIEDSIATMRNLMMKTNTVLPKNPIKTGDIYLRVENSYIVDLMDSLIQEDGMEFDGVVDGSMKYIVEGWGFLGGKKVVVLSVDEFLSVKQHIAYQEDVLIRITINGYGLVDPESFQLLENKTLLVADTEYMNTGVSWIKTYTEMSTKVFQ